MEAKLVEMAKDNAEMRTLDPAWWASVQTLIKTLRNYPMFKEETPEQWLYHMRVMYRLDDWPGYLDLMTCEV